MAWMSNYLSIWILESDTEDLQLKILWILLQFLSSFWSRILGKSCVWSMIKHGLSFLCILCIYCLHMTIFMNKFCIYKQMLGEYYLCKSTYIRVTLLKIDTYIHCSVALICLCWRKSKQNLWVYGPIHMMTSSNGKFFHITGPLCGEFTVPGEFPTQRPVTRSFGVFFWFVSE